MNSIQVLLQNTGTETVSLVEASQRLLTLLRETEHDRIAAALMASDPAILEVGPLVGPTPEESSRRRLLAHIRNLAENPGSSVAADPAIVQLGPAHQKVSEGQRAAPPSPPNGEEQARANSCSSCCCQGH